MDQGSDFVPNIYTLCKTTVYDPDRKHLLITLKKAHGLVAGDRVRLLHEGGMMEKDVVYVPDLISFVVKADRDPGRLFVYAKRVKDFLFIDYDAVAMLKVSATRELLRRV